MEVFKIGVGVSMTDVFWVKRVRGPSEGSSWMLSETMIRGFSICVELGNIAGGIRVMEGIVTGSRDVGRAGISGLVVEGGGCEAMASAGRDEEEPAAVEGGPVEAGFCEEALGSYLKFSVRSHSPYCPARMFCKLATSVRLEHDFSRWPT